MKKGASLPHPVQATGCKTLERKSEFYNANICKVRVRCICACRYILGVLNIMKFPLQERREFLINA
jgi:hypothetical protein